MKIRNFTTIIFTLAVLSIRGQEHADSIKYSINTLFNCGSGSYAPFLSSYNQYDKFSLTPNSFSIWGNIHKEINNQKKFDYGFGLELNGNVSKKETRFLTDEYYAQLKFFFLNLFAGAKQEVFGNQDAELSSGGILWSQNSRPMPKISIETTGYIGVPFTKNYVAVKGGLSHGWFENSREAKDLLLHHKYAYIKLGGSFPVNLSYGLNHVVQWGGVSPSMGTMPVTLDNYLRIFMGKSGSSSASMSDQINTLGNHIVSQNLGLDLNLLSILVSVYWQNLTEDPPVRFITNTPNIKDGLWGLSVKLPNFKPFNAFVLEYISTTDQSGPWHDFDGVIFGGNDSYFRNYGWTYNKMTIGNPWITSPNYNSDGLQWVENNLVRLYYFSGKGAYKELSYKLTLAYSENFGMINDNRTTPSYQNYKEQFSYQLEASTPISFFKNSQISIAVSQDRGSMYGNNLAVLLGFSYRGIFEISKKQ